MSTATKNFSFNQSSQGLPYTANGGSWAWNAGGGALLSAIIGTGDDSGNDSNAGNGNLQAQRDGRNRTDGTPYWEWSGTWEDLGVPSGSTVTAVNLDYDWKCSVYSTGASSTYGPAELRDSGGSLLATISTSGSFTSTTSWATKAGTNQTGLSQASNTSIKLRIGAKPCTGNSINGQVILLFDWVTVTITYSASTTYTASGSGGASSGGGAGISRTLACTPAASGGRADISTGGAASVSRTGAWTPAGGVSSGGTATATFEAGISVYTCIGSGGLTAGGSAGIARTGCHTAGGGAQLAGSALVATTRDSVGTGGATVSGAGAFSGVHIVLGSGGVLTAGQADISRTVVVVPSGGIVAGGSAASQKLTEFTVSGSGGTTLAGGADVTRETAWTPLGGASAGGSALLERATVVVGSGGISVAGSAYSYVQRIIRPPLKATLGGSGVSSVTIASGATAATIASGRTRVSVTSNVTGAVLADSQTFIEDAP